MVDLADELHRLNLQGVDSHLGPRASVVGVLHRLCRRGDPAWGQGIALVKVSGTLVVESGVAASQVRAESACNCGLVDLAGSDRRADLSSDVNRDH